MDGIHETERWATIAVNDDTITFGLWEPAGTDDEPAQVAGETVPIASLPERPQLILGVDDAHEETFEARDYRWLEIEFTTDTIHVDLFHYSTERDQPLLADTVDIQMADLPAADGTTIGDGDPLDG